ncbi:helix-turn-helix transcriptional regulator [Serratia nevei]|uniref:helix-turn-helix transcriptional regulator n=1 Tax=Serratia nevei TaxID=2703794 RepID=UPI003FA71B15
MSNKITIAIYDDDYYFSQGLTHCLRKYFAPRGKTVRFTRSRAEKQQPDIVFTSSIFGYRQQFDTGSSSLIFMIKNYYNHRLKADSRCLRLSGVVYRYDDFASLSAILDRVLHKASLGERQKECQYWGHEKLTTREQQVMNYLRRGISQSDVAYHMQLSVKTVHSHKRSVMRKMMLNNKHEFIYWLLN